MFGWTTKKFDVVVEIYYKMLVYSSNQGSDCSILSSSDLSGAELNSLY